MSQAVELEQTNQHIADTLHRQRRERGWSLDRAAAETGVSKAMLGQIERGESSPTVSTLWKIATGFQTSLSGFLESVPAAPSKPLLRDADQIRIRPGGEAGDGMLVAPLFPFDPALGFELFELTLPPGYVRESEAHEAGVTEIVAVLRGELELLVESEWRPVAAGQALRFAADSPHGYRNLSEQPAVFHNVIRYPARRT